MSAIRSAQQDSHRTMVFQPVERKPGSVEAALEPPLNLPLTKGEKPPLAHTNLTENCTLEPEYRPLAATCCVPPRGLLH
ncbi:MAG TPA: hypothetical protein VMM56_06750 [Planctomycetaceae bacterium]|nr:hypothetical protein [Planctomycetaceae bacterium]